MLLTSEYAVLDGAKAIALPTKFGQSLECKPNKGSDLIWSALDNKGKEWFSAQISLIDFDAIKSSDKNQAKELQKLLKNAVRLNSEFLSKWNGFKVTTKLDFPLDWGLGSSSTLTYLVAEWADAHPLLLHFKNNLGSGYDVACAGADGPISYQLKDDEVKWEEIDFELKFSDHLHFIHLGQKQSSNDAIAYYTKTLKKKDEFVDSCNQLTNEFLKCSSLGSFMKLMNEHEKLVSNTLKIETAKEIHFKNFNGSVKSLGAWGGDFVLAASELSKSEVHKYFIEKGFKDCFSYSDFVL